MPTERRTASGSDESTSLKALLLALTFITGMVDAVSVLGLGRVFTANMTGNVVFLSFAVAGAAGFAAAGYLVALAAFLVGAVVGGRLGSHLDGSQRRWLVTVALIEAGILFVAACVAAGSDGEPLAPAARLYALLGLTAVAMGLRNATVRRLGVADMTTTVLTLTLTGLGADSWVAGGKDPRWGRRLGSIVAMLLGATLGAILVLQVGLAWPLAVTGALTIVATLLHVGRWGGASRASTASSSA